ncbi:MAG: ribosomal RNA small subunit methyltransferase A [Actinobacteria bacterium]|nr:ribosomal RNA small subunit methyltransferase A [Actinomycetota bacterium]MCG2791375.1 16S rRNA (adenine(1518)-N(6)/adenine(1519)-N(6))-dimethyltransferase RsmA [Actinomycetes bacterium]
MHSYISSPGKTVQILSRYGIRLKKSLGQNFLIDTNSAKKIISYAGVNADDVILEVGSGIGSLTEILFPKVKRVVCVEIDNLLIEAFKDIFSENLGEKIQLIQADALKLNYTDIAGKYKINKVVSNLPYSIAAPLILKILIEAEDIKKLFITIQKDIAERLLASAGDKNYSSYTVKSNFLADFNFCFQISRNCFLPKPFVGSAVVEVSRKDNRVLMDENFKTGDFFDFINSCFLHRRKKLINSLSQSNTRYCYKLELIIKLLSEIGKNRDVRAEELYLKDYISLYKKLNT